MLHIEPVPKSKRVTISDIVIEVTRRCNMNCCHCMRGEPQNIDMDLNHVRAFFKQIDMIGCLTLSGGEPSLVPHILTSIIDIAKEEEVEIDSFYIATNAKVVTDEFIIAIIKWWLFCGDNEISGVAISSDIYHENIDEDNIKKLEALRFVKKRNEDYHYNHGQGLIYEGRAAENFAASHIIEPEEVDYEEDCDQIHNTLSFDCLGNLHTCCDLSYDTMDEGKFCIGNVSENNFNLINAIKSYNLKFEEVDYARTGT